MRRYSSKKRSFLPIYCLIGVIIFFLIIRLIISSSNRIDFFEYYDLDKESKVIVVNDELTDFIAQEDEDDIYFELDFLKEHIDPYIFWDEEEKKLTITTEDKVIRMKSEELDYYINNEPFSLDIPFFIQNNKPFIPSSVLKELYNLKINKNSTTNIISVDLNEDYYTAEALKNTTLTFKKNIKGEKINYVLKKGTSVYVYPEKSNDEFYKIRTDIGFIGYAKKKNFSEPKLNKAISEKQDEPKKELNTKINLTFEQVTSYAANNSFGSKPPEGVNVLCPTWFSFEDTEANIRNIADKAYVDAAHENGAQVWALITDNFTNSISHSALATSSAREKVIKQLLAFVALYDLDGINIDFEAVPKDDGEYYVQFLRELAPLLKQQDVVLSVDMFVPKSWTKHYNRREVAKVVDYIIVMGYDEHYSGGGVSGSVASIDWSRLAITATLDEDVPKEKLILGVPFYTRLWKETTDENGTTVSAKAYGMDKAKEIIKENDAEFTWLDEVGQYYAEYQDNNGDTYKLWLEDERSMRGRIKLVNEYKIAGCASWKRGFESDNIWKAIDEELNS